MITGAHIIIYSKDPEADRAFLRDVFKLSHVDVGGGWLIFGLPPSEIAIHPAGEEAHEVWFLCDNLDSFLAAMTAHKLTCDPVEEQSWGKLTRLTLPGGGKVGIYQPKHPRPAPMSL